MEWCRQHGPEAEALGSDLAVPRTTRWTPSLALQLEEAVLTKSTPHRSIVEDKITRVLTPFLRISHDIHTIAITRKSLRKAYPSRRQRTLTLVFRSQQSAEHVLH